MKTFLNNRVLKPTTWPHVAGGFALILLGVLAWYDLHCLGSDEARLHYEQQALVNFLRNEATLRTRHADKLAALQQATTNAQQWRANGTGTTDDAAFLAQISQLARSEGVVVKNFSPSPAAENGQDVQFAVTGPFGKLCRFLNNLDQAATLCEVTNCAVSANSQTTDGCTLDLKIRLLTTNQVLQRVAATAK